MYALYIIRIMTLTKWPKVAKHVFTQVPFSALGAVRFVFIITICFIKSNYN